MNESKRLTEIITDSLNRVPVPRGDDGIPLEPARIVNGRGGRASGFDDLNIDIYPPLFFVTVYREYSDEEIGLIGDVLLNIFDNHPILIQDRSVRPLVTRLKRGEVPAEFIVEEGGLRFYLNPLRGQNPGFFPDMRDGRELIRKIIEQFRAEKIDDIRVLNLFAYTCALSVAALSVGATKVVNIDKNSRSLDIGKKNHRLNHGKFSGGFQNQASFLPHDIFKSIGKLKKGGPYNLIIADPPPSQKGSFTLTRDYPRLLKRLAEMLKPGGKIILTLNSPSWSWKDFEYMIKDCMPDFHHIEKVQPPDDFAPVEDGRGLKIFLLS